MGEWVGESERKTDGKTDRKKKREKEGTSLWYLFPLVSASGSFSSPLSL